MTAGPLDGIRVLETHQRRSGSLGLPIAGRHGRRRHQGGAALRRLQPYPGRFAQPGDGRALPDLQPQQARPGSGPQETCRKGSGAAPGARRGRAGSQQPSRRDDAPGARIRRPPGGQSADHLLRDLRLRQGRALCPAGRAGRLDPVGQRLCHAARDGAGRTALRAQRGSGQDHGDHGGLRRAGCAVSPRTGPARGRSWKCRCSKPWCHSSWPSTCGARCSIRRCPRPATSG